jgi:hypothetical protein
MGSAEPLGPVGEHHHGIVDASFRVHDLPLRIGDATEVDRVEGAHQEVDRATRSADDQVRGYTVVTLRLGLCELHRSSVHRSPLTTVRETSRLFEGALLVASSSVSASR